MTQEKCLSQGMLISCNDIPADFLKLIASSCVNFDKDPAQLRPSSKTPNYYIIVLSQDCDIANPSEKYVELILGKESTRNPKKEKGRSFSSLRLPVEHQLTIAVESNYICHILKSELPQNIVEHAIRLSPTNHNILIQWRVQRYARRPLPDKFNKLFLTYVREESTGFFDYFERAHSEIIDIYLFISTLEEDAGEYWVSFTILLEETCSTQKSEEIRETMLQHINAIRDKSDGVIRFCQLEPENIPDDINDQITNSSIAAYPEDFSMADKLRMHPINLMYLCWPEGA